MGTIQIVCVGHSGSSIINLILGRHKKLFSVGEIRSIYECYNSELCACGKQIIKCDFWSEIFYNVDKLSTLRDGSLRGRKGKVILTLIDIFILLGNKKIYNFLSKFSIKLRTTLNATKKNLELLNYVQNKIGDQIIVDSSKNPIRGKLLFELDNTTKFVYLKRDGRGVTNSWVKAFNYSFEYSLFQWMFRDILVKLYLFFIPKKNILVIEYEDFCKNPKNVLKSITKFIGVLFDEKMLYYRNVKRHDIHVNPNSFANRKGIQLDEKWRDALDKENMRKFNLFGGLYNRLNGYSK